MFGSVSDLVLKAKQPPYKVATHTGSLIFNNLTGAILAVIKSQRSEPNVARLNILSATDHEIDRNHVDVDCDGTFGTDEANNARSRNRVTRRRTQPDESATSLTDLLSERSPISWGRPPSEMYVDEMGASLLRDAIPAMPTVRGRSEATDRAVMNDYREAHSVLDLMRAGVERGAYDSGEHINRYATIMRRVWSHLNKDQVIQLTVKTRGILGTVRVNGAMSGAYLNILRKWMYVMIIHQIVNTNTAQTVLTNLLHEYADEKTYWQDRLRNDAVVYTSAEARQVGQHNMADAINHLTYHIDLIQGLMTGSNLQATRELASGMVVSERIRWIEELFFNWIHGLSNTQVAVRGLVSLTLLFRLPSEAFDGDGHILRVHHRHLPIRRRVAIPLVMLIRSRAMLSEKVKMTLTCGHTLDTLAFSCNAVGRHSGQYLLQAMREMIIRIEPNEQSNILDFLWRDLMRSIEHHNDCHITRFHNPM